MADGSLSFLEAMNSCHGVEDRWRSRNAGKWIKYSHNRRKEMAAKFGLIDGSNVLEATPERLQAIDWEEPDVSYSKGRFSFLATLEREEQAELKETEPEPDETPEPSTTRATVAGIDPRYLEGIRDEGSEPGSLGETLSELEKKYGADRPE